MGCIRLSPALLYRPDGGRHHDLNCGRLPYPRCEIVTEPGKPSRRDHARFVIAEKPE